MSSRRVDMLSAFCAEFLIPTLQERPIAIYFLIRQGEIVYVGQTVNIGQRVALHRTKKRHRTWHKSRVHRTFDRVLYFNVSPDDADAFEGALIRALNPRWSKRGPIDDSRDAEVLATIGMTPSQRARSSFENRNRERVARQVARRMADRQLRSKVA